MSKSEHIKAVYLNFFRYTAMILWDIAEETKKPIDNEYAYIYFGLMIGASKYRKIDCSETNDE